MDKASFRRAGRIQHGQERLPGQVASVPSPPAEPDCETLAIGIDIESADNLPSWGDAGSEPFYAENFTRAEIAWCLRQPEPQLAFCGLWSAKEAALKCGQEFASLRPVEIEIVHDERGRPTLQAKSASPQALGGDCVLSISHAGRMGVAVCVKRQQGHRF